MIAYNTKLLDNLAIHKKAKQWYANGLLTTQQMAAILNTYAISYFKPNVFIRIGLFIFTLFLVSAALGIVSTFSIAIFAVSDSFKAFGIFASILILGLTLFFLEKFIVWRNWYSNGIDDALLYCAFGAYISFISFSISNINNENNFALVLNLFCLPFLFFAMKRYLDRVIALLFALCVYVTFFLLLLKLGNIAKLIMPFALMLVSGIIIFVVNTRIKKDSIFHLKNCLLTIKVVAMLVLYLSGNYFVIRESSIAFFNLELTNEQDITLAWFFYLYTALVPIIYMYVSFKKKNKLILLTGLLLIATSVLTFKYYFSLGHPEVTLTLAGIIMILISYFAIRYLKTDKHGISFKDDPNEDNFLKSNAEALVIAQSFGTQSTTANNNGVEMGGGDFGGAGSGSKF